MNRPSWSEALAEFLLHKRAGGIREETLRGYERHVKQFFKLYPQAWDDMTVLRHSAFEWLSEPVKPATYNLRLVYLRAFLEWCREQGYVEDNPLRKFKRRKADSRIVQLSEETLRALLQLPDQKTFSGLRDYALLLLTLDTGIRPNEAFQLRADDFDFRTLSVRIRAEASKTKTSRFLPISPQTAQAVRKLLKAHHPHWNGKAPVFCTFDGRPLTRHAWNDRLEMYSKRLGVKIRPYDLRHAFALLFLRHGGHAFALQRIMGHSDMSMTKRYVALTQEDLKDIHAVATPLSAVLEPPRPRRRKL
ncbi:tyrosine-type recombinase/integrase [Brockia lithotrophica]|uniref:Site-specific recombinase XerD n=1 Tax=Brockia lithotrophica TaxID=933949 RepID=A0A660L2J8_9BACL|nr:site-specific integrase [Brockia lithotrophica]RKQ85415.1 site-specific recombinase XerD [Brockia lithotrophica]